MHGTRLGKQGRRIAGRSYGSSEAEAEFGTQNAGATHARRTAQGPSTIAHPNRERPRVCHSPKPSQVARSRPRLSRQKNRRLELVKFPTGIAFSHFRHGRTHCHTERSEGSQFVHTSVVPNGCDPLSADKIPRQPPKIIHVIMRQYVSEQVADSLARRNLSIDSFAAREDFLQRSIPQQISGNLTQRLAGIKNIAVRIHPG